MTRAISKAKLYARLGYAPPYDTFEAALEQAGLSRPEKGAISPRKADAVEELLAGRFVAVCSRGDCRAEALTDGGGGAADPASDGHPGAAGVSADGHPGAAGVSADGDPGAAGVPGRAADGRLIVPAATQADCVVCGGSAHGREVDRMVEAWRRAGLGRLCVVGGSPNARMELEDLVEGRLELRLVDGTTNRAAGQVAADLAWADRVALWGGTQLDHRVSEKYRGPHVVQFARRGIGALARAMVRSAAKEG